MFRLCLNALRVRHLLRHVTALDRLRVHRSAMRRRLESVEAALELEGQHRATVQAGDELREGRAMEKIALHWCCELARMRCEWRGTC